MKMFVNIIKSYRDTVAVCDKELVGKKFEEPFEGYGTTRQKIHKYVETQWALSLDADEILMPESIPILSRLQSSGKFDSVAIPFYSVGYTSNTEERRYSWNPRFYKLSALSFSEGQAELPKFDKNRNIFGEGTKIIHFTPSDINAKYDWCLYTEDGKEGDVHPFKMENFDEVRSPNPVILKSYGIDFEATLKKLQQMEIEIPAYYSVSH